MITLVLQMCKSTVKTTVLNKVLCCGLNLKCHLQLLCINTWFPTSDAVWEAKRTFLEELSY